MPPCVAVAISLLGAVACSSNAPIAEPIGPVESVEPSEPAAPEMPRRLVSTGWANGRANAARDAVGLGQAALVHVTVRPTEGLSAFARPRGFPRWRSVGTGHA